MATKMYAVLLEFASRGPAKSSFSSSFGFVWTHLSAFLATLSFLDDLRMHFGPTDVVGSVQHSKLARVVLV